MLKKAGHISFLDFLRGLAIFFVFTYHLHELTIGKAFVVWDGWFPKAPESIVTWLFLPISFGWTAVALFFVISGFCIHLSFERTPGQSSFVFLVRRVLRLYPVYLIALILFAKDFSFSSLTAQFESHLLLIHNFGVSTFSGINPSFWSIAVEFQLYLLYPVLRCLVRRTSWTKTLLILGFVEFSLRLASSLSFTFYGKEFGRMITGSPFYFWFSWAIGAAIADMHLKGKRMPMPRIPLWLFPLVTVLSEFYKPTTDLSFLFASVSYAIIIGRLLDNKPREMKGSVGYLYNHLSFVGVFSYSVYLFHQPILIKYSYNIRSQFPWVLEHQVAWYLLSNVLWFWCSFSHTFFILVSRGRVLSALMH